MVLDEKYDVIVVGGGHAGCEAAYSAAKMGANVLMITMNMQTIGQMSCNPAMGGVAKGQIVREIDALGGGSARITDKSMIQFRMLNRSKGPAMWSPRVQSDRMLFAQYWRELLEETPGLNMFQDMVTGLNVSENTVHGVKTALGLSFEVSLVLRAITRLKSKEVVGLHTRLKRFTIFLKKASIGPRYSTVRSAGQGHDTVHL